MYIGNFWNRQAYYSVSATFRCQIPYKQFANAINDLLTCTGCNYWFSVAPYIDRYYVKNDFVYRFITHNGYVQETIDHKNYSLEVGLCNIAVFAFKDALVD